MPRESLGAFEQIVLLACVRLRGNAYTVSVVEEIAARTGRRPSPSAVYAALRRLEDKGLVRSELGESTPERGGRPKRFFDVQPEALRLLEEAREHFMSMWDGLEGAS